MRTRYVFPELFHAAGASIMVQGNPRLALRWILHPSLGLPRALFHVWRFEGQVEFKRLAFRQIQIGDDNLVTWPEGGAVAVRLILSTPTSSVVLRAYSGASGTGHIVDQKTIVGPVSSLPVILTGTPASSITITGSASIEDATFVPMQDFVNHPGWNLIETVGLPVSSPLFDSSKYPLSHQGLVGAEEDPVSAAIRRVGEGTPDEGWSGTTDRGTPPEPFIPPDPGTLVTHELMPLLEGMANVLEIVADPVDQAEQEVEIVTTAPRSVQGKDASGAWHAQARPARIWPLTSMLLMAGGDPFGALALGFGTTFDDHPQQDNPFADRPMFHDIYMVTVEHEVQQNFADPFPLNVTLNGELAALYLGHEPPLPSPPAGLSASARTPPHLDPPGIIDGRWLQVAEISWVVPVLTNALGARPSGYAIARGAPGAEMEIRTEERLSGGRVPFVAATAPNVKSLASVRFSDTGVPEVFPGESPNLVYSIAAHDWFGRWSDWVSVDYPLASVAPQVPAVRKVEVTVTADNLPTQNTSAAIEFTWDWTHRRPSQIHLRLLVHPADAPPPAVPGSVLSIGGPTVADRIIDFSMATESSPPAGVDHIPDEDLSNLRTYRVTVGGIELAFGSHPRQRITARARATERVVPTRLSAWSPDTSTDVASPIPPPEPFVPAEMWWASIPDSRGVVRTRLEWAATAPLYAVYLADETALRRELDQPSADLEISATDRLIDLRTLDIGRARRAFRRIADRVPTNSLEIELPRGSRLIHFYGIVPISSTGVEGSLPSSSNSYFAVAAPMVATPETPRLAGRDLGGLIGLSVEVPETRVKAARIEIYRASSPHRAVSTEMMGPPIAVLNASSGVRSGGSIRWQVEDTTFGPSWKPVFYRAVAYGVTDRSRGEYGGKSFPTRAVEVIPSSTLPPPLEGLAVEDQDSHPDYRLVSFVCDAALERTSLGVHTFAIQTVALDASVATRRITTDALPLISVGLPTPEEQPDTIFRYDPMNPRNGLTYAWVPRDVRVIVVSVTDPAGRTTHATWEVI